jgi:hypothetical protein
MITTPGSTHLLLVNMVKTPLIPIDVPILITVFHIARGSGIARNHDNVGLSALKHDITLAFPQSNP